MSMRFGVWEEIWVILDNRFFLLKKKEGYCRVYYVL